MQTVFADGLHVPIGIELGDGGVYVSQMPNLMFLKDTNGDDRADTRELIMHGFDTADSHHAMHAFTWDPGGALLLAGGDVPLLAGRDAVRPAAVQRGGRLPMGAADLEVRRLRLVRVRQPVGPLHRRAGARTSSPTPRAGPTTSARRSRARSSIPRSTAG